MPIFFSTLSIYLFSFGGAIFSVSLLLLFSFFIGRIHSSSILLAGISLGILFTSLVFILAYYVEYQKSLLILRLNLGNLGSIEYFEMMVLIFSFFDSAFFDALLQK